MKNKWIVVVLFVLFIFSSNCALIFKGKDSERCDASRVWQGDKCGCSVIPPVNLTDVINQNENDPIFEMKLWPFGVHGSHGHPEGHPGVDIVSSSPNEIVASGDGVIVGMDQTDNIKGNTLVSIKLDCGLQIWLSEVIPIQGLNIGSKVKQGDKIGDMGVIGGVNRYFVHFGIMAFSPSKDYPANVCPKMVLEKKDLDDLEVLLSLSTYDEQKPHEAELKCLDGTLQKFSFLGENDLCQPRLSEPEATDLGNCLGIPVW